jgi:phosphatidylglycerol:prolipoprotein diacylglycerol transferase
MHPVLFEIRGFPIHTYGVLLAAAYLLGLQMAVSRARRFGLEPARIMDFGIAIIIAALVGAKALLLVVDYRKFVSDPRELLTLLRSGGVFYGGLLVAVPTAIWYVRRHALPTWTVGDLAAPGIALAHAVGRVGCLMAGCCFGRPSDLPWAITFTSTYATDKVGVPLDIGLHPTQLYETGAELLIFGYLLATERRGRPYPGRTFWTYVGLYAVTRFVIEFYRGDSRGMVGPLSTSQFVSVLLVPLAVGMLAWLSRRRTPPAPAAARRRRAA